MFLFHIKIVQKEPLTFAEAVWSPEDGALLYDAIVSEDVPHVVFRLLLAAGGGGDQLIDQLFK